MVWQNCKFKVWLTDKLIGQNFILHQAPEQGHVVLTFNRVKKHEIKLGQNVAKNPIDLKDRLKSREMNSANLSANMPQSEELN